MFSPDGAPCVSSCSRRRDFNGDNCPSTYFVNFSRGVFGKFSDLKLPNWWSVPRLGRHTVMISVTVSAYFVTVKKQETAYRLNITVMLRYRRKSTVIV